MNYGDQTGYAGDEKCTWKATKVGQENNRQRWPHFFSVIFIIYGQYNATFDEWTTLMMVRSLRKYIKYQQPNALGMSAKVYVVTFVYARNVNGPYVVIRCHANIMDDLRPRKTDQSDTSIIWAQLTISVYLFVAAAQQQQ